ncbi:MAG: HupE/UreJ family protein [Gammaproteobacteria bacterium]|nr:HupE/UreJ family protein [Gammaproteobacteria bacterium]
MGNNLYREPKSNPAIIVGALALLLVPALVAAHSITGSNAQYVEAIDGPAIVPFMYLGAKHMVTGYDHLLYLVGVIFFVYRPRHVIQYVTLFTLGHSITLLFGVLGGYKVNANLIDAIIGLSIVYKAFENMGGFERVFNIRPNIPAAVFIFGLFHGFGLATKLQEFSLSENGLVTNILSFNLGVEIGQLMALSGVLIALGWWRTHRSFMTQAFNANTTLMAGGFILAGYQLVGYMVLPA